MNDDGGPAFPQLDKEPMKKSPRKQTLTRMQPVGVWLLSHGNKPMPCSKSEH